MKPTCSTIALVAAALLASAAPLSPAAEYIYLENTDGGTVSVIDIPGHTVVSSINVGTYLDDVCASSDGTMLYVNRVNTLGLAISPRIGESGEIVAIDTDTEQVQWRTAVNGWPHHMSLSADNRYLYVPLYDRQWMDVIDTRQRRVLQHFAIGLGGHGTQLSPDGKRLYVGSMFTDTLTVYDLATYEPVKRLAFKDAVRPFVFTRDEKTLYVQLSRLHGFDVVDLAADKIAREVALPALAADVKLPQFYPHTYNHGLAISPDEKLLLAAGSVAGYVCAYRLPQLELAATIPVGKEPNWIVFSGDGAYAYVSNRASDTLSVISVAELKETKQIPVGKYPQRMRVVDVPRRTGPTPAEEPAAADSNAAPAKGAP
ncbi:MAG: cytochrome D1 domain-containing protein [Pirellulales bacterium]